MEEQPQQEGTITRTLQDLPLKLSTDFRMIYARILSTLPCYLGI